VIFCGPAKKVTIRLCANDAMSAPICEALLAFLGPKDVCCVQMSFPESAVEIRFLARQGKVDALTDIARLIAPDALIHAENTTIVHAASDSRKDLRNERAISEFSLPIRSDLSAQTNTQGLSANSSAAQHRTAPAGFQTPIQQEVEHELFTNSGATPWHGYFEFACRVFSFGFGPRLFGLRRREADFGVQQHLLDRIREHGRCSGGRARIPSRRSPRGQRILIALALSPN